MLAFKITFWVSFYHLQATVISLHAPPSPDLPPFQAEPDHQQPNPATTATHAQQATSADIRFPTTAYQIFTPTAPTFTAFTSSIAIHNSSVAELAFRPAEQKTASRSELVLNQF